MLTDREFKARMNCAGPSAKLIRFSLAHAEALEPFQGCMRRRRCPHLQVIAGAAA